MIFRRYLLNTRYVKGATADAEMKRFREVVSYFRKYGSQYNLDWMLMTAQGYQESRLDQQAKSHVGAVGVMQIMPATGQEMKVGDITKIEPNIHGGVKYIRFMIDRYYAGEPMDDLNKVLFAFAAYNCGPGRVRQLRREAATRGLDANVWFDNVERMAAEKIGRETVTYVSNIYKYYVAYLLVQGEYMQRRALKKKDRPARHGRLAPATTSRSGGRPRSTQLSSLRASAAIRPSSTAGQLGWPGVRKIRIAPLSRIGNKADAAPAASS
jgi:membrane-bound lytic murein transglycosylase MltF